MNHDHHDPFSRLQSHPRRPSSGHRLCTPSSFSLSHPLRRTSQRRPRGIPFHPQVPPDHPSQAGQPGEARVRLTEPLGPVRRIVYVHPPSLAVSESHTDIPLSIPSFAHPYPQSLLEACDRRTRPTAIPSRYSPSDTISWRVVGALLMPRCIYRIPSTAIESTSWIIRSFPSGPVYPYRHI